MIIEDRRAGCSFRDRRIYALQSMHHGRLRRTDELVDRSLRPLFVTGLRPKQDLARRRVDVALHRGNRVTEDREVGSRPGSGASAKAASPAGGPPAEEPSKPTRGGP